MSLPSHCGICAGALVLRFPGRESPLTPEAFSPTNHRTGEHLDLYACRDCGTVQQPGLPRGGELHALYRDMVDGAYLAEERGRRITANRVLDLIAPHVAAGRLLEVGCGHGLLLDEARRRGHEVTGLDLSAGAAAHAREVLGLDVREHTLDEHVASGAGPYDVVVLADMLEHHDDPRREIDTSAGLLAPGGVLCVITPDPSSPTARLAGARWWGYLPSHTFLLPHRTLLELLTGRGLVVSAEAPLVRTFSARYWLAGLAERGGPVARAVGAVERVLSPERMLSLSLGDERIVLAHRALVEHPPEPLARDRGGERKVHVVLPAHNAAATVGLVASEMPALAADRALLIDDASTDDTREAALAAGFEVLRHPANRGYGANQKTCYVRAALDGADVIVMVHADNQYDPGMVAKMVRPILEGRADVVIGSRLLHDETIAGGMPRWKWLGNRALTWVENRAFRRRFSEYHTGYRAFSVEFLRQVPFLRNSDGFVFDQEIFAQAVARGARVLELAIPTRYFLEASSVSFTTSVEYGLRTLGVLARFRLDRRRGTWPLLRRPAVDLRPQSGTRAPAAGASSPAP
jgi:SAM-dependent methyltransferase